MKNLILALVAATTFNASAFTRSGGSVEFTRISIQKGTLLAGKNITSGSVSVDLRGRGELTVNLQPAFFCPADMICPQVMPAAIQYSVELQKISTGTCGETIYSGSMGQNVADGIRTSITVVDHSTDECKYFAPIDATEVTLTLVGGFMPEDAKHEFFAKDLLK